LPQGSLKTSVTLVVGPPLSHAFVSSGSSVSAVTTPVEGVVAIVLPPRSTPPMKRIR